MPERIVTSCPNCGRTAVALVGETTPGTPDTKVVWCEYGHVSVCKATGESQLVFSFQEN